VKLKMSDIKYEEICELWITCHSWTLDDALSLLMKRLPSPYPSTPNPTIEEKIKPLKTLAHNSLGGSLDILPPIPGDATNSIRISPLQFIAWIESLGIPITPHLNKARLDLIKKSGQPSRKLTPTQIHKHRCRSLAEYFWTQDPDITKATMAQKPELLKIACEDKHYTSKTIEGWIKVLNPDRSQGRRKSQ